MRFWVPLGTVTRRFGSDGISVKSYEPEADDEVTVWLVGSHSYRYRPTVEGSVLRFEDRGELRKGVYDLLVTIRKANGDRLRSKWPGVLNVVDETPVALAEIGEESDIIATEEWTELVAAAYEAVQGEDGQPGKPGPPGEGFHIFTPYRLSLIRHWPAHSGSVRAQRLWLQGDWQKMIADGYVPYLFRNTRQKQYRLAEGKAHTYERNGVVSGWQRLGDHTTLRVTEEGVLEFVRTMERWRNDDGNHIDEHHFENNNKLGPVVAWRNDGDYGYSSKIKDWLPRIVTVATPDAEAPDGIRKRHYADLGEYDYPEPKSETIERSRAYVPTGTGRRRTYFTQAECRSDAYNRRWYQGKYRTVEPEYGIGFARPGDDVTTGDLVTPLVTFRVRNIWVRDPGEGTNRVSWIYLV